MKLKKGDLLIDISDLHVVEFLEYSSKLGEDFLGKTLSIDSNLNGTFNIGDLDRVTFKYFKRLTPLSAALYGVDYNELTKTDK